MTKEPFINNTTNFNVLLKALPTKGHIAWEYNPFHNYRLDEDLYEYEGYYYTLYELASKFGIFLNCSITRNEKDNTISYTITGSIDTEGKTIINDVSNHLDILKEAFDPNRKGLRQKLTQALFKEKDRISGWIGVPDNKTEPYLREKGELVDFVTNELKFNINNPVDILPQNSYDDSVNLIMNDGFSYPKLINSRFSPRGKNTYEIVDRKGNSDTNIYDRGEQFKTDTSLYKIINTFPKLELVKITSGGALKVGNYFFYFRLVDSDGNETDFFEESGLVSIFKGSNNYRSVSTGERDENSVKQVNFKLTNLDSSYSYVYVYYSRTSAENQENSYTSYAKIELKYLINNNAEANILITGFEPITNIDAKDLNLTYVLLDYAQTQASCLNRLFLANVQKSKINYKELADLSLRILPYGALEYYNVQLTEKYGLQSSNQGYIDPIFIYNKTGYWNNEYYRFGIVYIMKNGELSPVFDVRGAYNVPMFEDEISYYSDIPISENNERKYIEYDEENFKLITIDNPGNAIYENVKGVVRLDLEKDTNQINYIKFRIPYGVIEEIKKLNVKGFFFVRLHRIPTILTLGITIGVDNNARVPTIPVLGANVANKFEDVSHTHIQTNSINDINYISEGFLSRYKFKFEKKSSGIWGKIAKIAAITVGVIALAAASVVTFGGASIVAGAIAAVGSAVGASVATAGAVGAVVIAAAAGVGTAVTGVVAATTQEIGLAISRIGEDVKWNGRETETPHGMKKVEDDTSRKLILEYWKRVIIKDKDENTNQVVICPDYDVASAYYNSIFTGNEHYIETTTSQAPLAVKEEKLEYVRYFENNNRHYYIPLYGDVNYKKHIKSKIVGITDSLKIVSVDDLLFKARAGEAEEAWKYEAITKLHLKDKDNEFDSSNTEGKKINSDIVRGNYGPYLALSEDYFGPCETINIYTPGFDPNNYSEYIKIRINNHSAYKAITHRINIQDLDEYSLKNTALLDETSDYTFNVFRGDCYICQYTHRLNRNFNSPSSPYNDEIVDENCWKNGYNPGETSDYGDINLGDVNAIQLGLWLTFRIRSSYNHNIPTVDNSNVEELLMSGHARSRYPLIPMSVDGSYKISDSMIYNKGFATSLGERYYQEVPEAPYLKNWFGTRIMYSDIQISDGFKNGFRQFWATNHQDYALDYGSIIKLIGLEGSLFCVFEHGLAIIPVNERTVSGLSEGGNVYINTDNVLPLNPRMISDTIGSLWKDSVIKTERGIIYGVDTVAKKIWMYAGGEEIKCISDFSMQEFLNENISLSERELDPIIGIRNVKTHYNAFKHDVMFTFYDNMYDFEEKVWNLCWNELLNKWITFYSWVPSYSENIYNQYFSFDRNTSKYIAKLGTSKARNDFSDGVVLSENIITYTPNDNSEKHLVGILDLANRTLPEGDGVEYTINYELKRDIWGNYNNFTIKYVLLDTNNNIINSSDEYNEDYKNQALYCTCKLEDLRTELYQQVLHNVNNPTEADIIKNPYNNGNWKQLKTKAYKSDTGIKLMLEEDILKAHPFKPVIYLNIRANIKVTEKSDSKTFAEAYVLGFNNRIEMDAGYYQSMIAVTLDLNLQFLTTDFWKHGLSGIIDIKDPILPTYWYGKQHPFEFEFVVKDSEWNHKIFNNLHILSNLAEPESFHFEITGESYDFAEFKKNMYIRLEATKELYQYNGTDIVFDHGYKNLVDIVPQPITTRTLLTKSAIFPLYYYRLDTINEIEDAYHFRNGCSSKDYSHMAGAEIAYYKTLGEYRIVNHVPAIDMKGWDYSNGYREEIGRIRGNMEYKEDFWNMQINPINIVYNNEVTSDCVAIGDKININNSNFYIDLLKKYLTPIVYNLFEDCGLNYRQAIFGEDNPNNTKGVDLTKESSEEKKNEKGNVVLGIPEDWKRNVTWWGDMENLNQMLRIKDKYLKVRVRYSGNKLAIIKAIRTLYSISFA